MIRHGTRLLVVLAVFALVVEFFDTLGWLRWKHAAKVLADTPDSGAVLLSSDPLLALPGAVHSSRRLVARSLGLASRETVIGALERLGYQQRRWFPASPVGFVNQARETLLRDHVESANEVLREALIRDPTSAYVHRLRASVNLYLGRVEQALEDLAFAEGLAPGMSSPPIEILEEHQRLVRLQGLNHRRELYPRNRVETALALARLLRSEGDFLGADSVVEEYRGEPEVEIEIAQWKIDAGEYQAAVKLLESVTLRKSYPRRIRARAWSFMATASDLDGDEVATARAAQEALRLDPKSTAPYRALASAAWRRGDAERALSYLRSAWGLAPGDVRILTRFATVAEAAGKHSDAVLALERAVELSPDSSDLWARLVEVQLRGGDYSDATVTLSKALDRFPTDPRLLTLTERLRREIGVR